MPDAPAAPGSLALSLLDALARVFLDWVAANLDSTNPDHDPPPRPGPIVATLTREAGPMLIYTVTLPPPGAPDVVQREFSSQVGVNPATVTVLGLNDPAPEVSANDGDSVTLILIDIDDANPPNRSEASTLTFTATDTIAPPKPGEIGVTLSREE